MPVPNPESHEIYHPHIWFQTVSHRSQFCKKYNHLFSYSHLPLEIQTTISASAFGYLPGSFSFLSETLFKTVPLFSLFHFFTDFPCFEVLPAFFFSALLLIPVNRPAYMDISIFPHFPVSAPFRPVVHDKSQENADKQSCNMSGIIHTGTGKTKIQGANDYDNQLPRA